MPQQAQWAGQSQWQDGKQLNTGQSWKKPVRGWHYRGWGSVSSQTTNLKKTKKQNMLMFQNDPEKYELKSNWESLKVYVPICSLSNSSEHEQPL